MNKQTNIILFLIIILGSFLRFYKLDWGNGLFTHPDEYHIVAAVHQLSFPDQMHPNFFSYGTVTIYLIYFTKELLASFNSYFSTLNFQLSTFLVGRFYSAFFSTITILVVYKISRFFLDKPFSLLAAFLVAITPGLIQQAHFTTPESNLIFFLFTSFLFMLYFLQYKKIQYILISSIFLGFALGVKISSIVFLAPFITVIILQYFRKPLRAVGLIIASIIFIFCTLAIVAPFIFLDFPAFKSNLDYEGHLAAGKFSVFYTRQFINTIPILFQLEKIFPFALGLPLLITGIGGFIFFLFHLRYKKYFILVITFLSIFLPNAFLFAKWTRFIAPTFPFFAIFSAFFFWEIAKKQKNASFIITVVLIVATSLWTCAFFNVYTKPDIRITASKWLVENTPPKSTIMIEGGNMVDIPLRGDFNRIGFDFYTIDENKDTRIQIAQGLEKADYFIVQSRRVFLNHQRSRKQFPKTAHFYDMLFTGQLGFKPIKEFHSFPSLEIGNWKLEIPDEVGEETWSVFDHPVIRIFQKTNKLSKNEYEKLFEE